MDREQELDGSVAATIWLRRRMSSVGRHPPHNVAPQCLSVSLVVCRCGGRRASAMVCASPVRCRCGHFGPPAMSLDSGSHVRCMEDRGRSDMTMADRAVSAANSDWKSTDCADGRLASGDMMRPLVNAVAEFEEVSKSSLMISAPCRCNGHETVAPPVFAGSALASPQPVFVIEKSVQISNSTPISIILSWGILK